ncbi:hypothetical protein OEZ86_013264 [Tetradesmus obliquus]|nr:hypothetical protein OEZ86_013264 [Tetradesmus obliquus]
MEKVMITRLQLIFSEKKEQARQLEEENRQLCARETILLAYCQTLSWLRQQESNEWMLAGLHSKQQQQEEGPLLPSDQEPSVAPDDDQLYYFRRIFSMAPFPGAADMTMQDASALYNEVVRELSLNLALHEAAVAAQRQPAASGGAPGWQKAGVRPWHNIRAAFDRLANCFVSLGQLQRSSIFMTAVLVNHADLS